MLTLIALACAALLNNVASHGAETNCFAEFYNALGGPYWYNDDGWAQIEGDDGDPCQAFGLECDDSMNVIGISLPMNNLTGELPACLRGMRTVREFCVSDNFITGTLINLPINVERVSLSRNLFTDIDSSFCKDLKISSFAMTYTNLNDATIPDCLFAVPDLSVMYTNLQFPEGLQELGLTSNRKGLIVAGMDASALQLIIPNETVRHMTKLDLSNTSISGTFNLSQLIFAFARVQDLYLGGNRLTGWIDFDAFKKPILASVIHTSTINLGFNSFKGIITGTQEIDTLLGAFSDSIYGIDLSNNKIIGVAPTTEEFQRLIIKYKDFYVLRLENNTFFCTEERTSLFDCTSVQIASVVVQSGKDGAGADTSDLIISIQLPGNVPEDLAKEVVSNLQFSDRKDANGQSDITLQPLTLMSAVYNEDLQATTLKTMVSGVEIAGDVSQLNLSLYWQSSNLTLKLDRRDNPIESRVSNDKVTVSSSFSASNNAHAYSQLHDPSQKKLLLDVYGMSRCPYFARYVTNDLNNLINAYPQMTDILTVRFSTLTSPSEYTATGGYASHGAAEATGDYYFLCLQNYTGYNNKLMVDYYMCMYRNGNTVFGIPYNVSRCNSKVLKQVYNMTAEDINTVTLCSKTRANSLISLSFERLLSIKVGFSPTLFLDNKLFCLDGVKCAFDTSPKSTQLRVANMVERLCAVYAEKYGAYENCTQRAPTAMSCSTDEVPIGAGCALQKTVVVIVSVCCVSFLLVLVASLVTYSIVKEVKTRALVAKTRQEKLNAALIDSDYSGSDAETI